ncbi:hypothetical protein CEXT_179311 [Caerostris extrusa]|uniref:Uncharacterized protein n=1 Tax=Caerostris extrusa TaxID=172846 RepID=A0AAV4Y3Z5_CAEEX|nr:hypothetical protein CEXT_179311 [Caerostris extrusa]
MGCRRIQIMKSRSHLILVLAGILRLLSNKSNQQDVEKRSTQTNIRNITDKTVKLAFRNQRLPSSMELLLNPFQLSKINQCTSFYFRRDDKVTVLHKFSAFFAENAIYIIAIKIIAVLSNSHEKMKEIENTTSQKAFQSLKLQNGFPAKRQVGFLHS